MELFWADDNLFYVDAVLMNKLFISVQFICLVIVGCFLEGGRWNTEAIGACQ